MTGVRALFRFRGRFRNGGNFSEALGSRKAAFGIAGLPGSWRLVGGKQQGGLWKVG